MDSQSCAELYCRSFHNVAADVRMLVSVLNLHCSHVSLHVNKKHKMQETNVVKRQRRAGRMFGLDFLLAFIPSLERTD